jgi:hypothetical protein
LIVEAQARDSGVAANAVYGGCVESMTSWQSPQWLAQQGHAKGVDDKQGAGLLLVVE